MSSGMRARQEELDLRRRWNVEEDMKSLNDLTLWSIIERLQRRLERQGMSPAEADRAVAQAVRVLAMAR